MASLPDTERTAPTVAGAPLWIDQPVSRVEIQGLRHTRPQVVLRELSVRTGDAIDWGRLERDRLRLLDLGLFADVAMVPRRDPRLDRPILEVRLRERPTFLAVPTIAWQEGEGFTYGASASTLNLGGMAQEAWLAAGAGAQRYLVAGYDTRWLLGRRLGAAIQGSLLRRKNPAQGTVEDHRGVSIGVAPAKGTHLAVPVDVGWETVRADPDPHPARRFSGRAVRRRDDHRWLDAGVRFDTRDYRARPRSGEVLAVGAATHGGLLGGTTSMERYGLDAMLVRPTGNMVFTIASRTILSRGTVPSFLRLDLGGAADLRGHPANAYEGSNVWTGWVEERFPLMPRREFSAPWPLHTTVDVTVDGALFVDVGAIWERGDWSRGRVKGRWGAGGGLRLVVPFAGLLSLDAATDGRHVETHILAGPRF